MTKRTTVLATSVGAVVLLLVAAWVQRPAIFRLLAARQLGAARSIVGAYLAGRMPLDSAAALLSPKLQRAVEYLELSEPSTNGGGNTASIVGIPIAPPG